MEITIDIADDSAAVHSMRAATEDPDRSLIRKTSVNRQLQQVTEELKRLDRLSEGTRPALKGLKFIASSSKDTKKDPWTIVEDKFDRLTADSNGRLHSSHFGECIGIEKSNEFAMLLFRTLARMMNISADSINKAELYDFWEELNGNGRVDSRLQIFFAMVDKDADGKITKEEVQEIISLSASTNNLSAIKNQAEEYAKLIMEELDRDNIGYITVESLEKLLLKAPNESERRANNRLLSKLRSAQLKPTKDTNCLRGASINFKRWAHENWRRIWAVTLWACVVLGLFVWKFVEFRNKASFSVMGYCVCVAKGGAETLKFNMALILLPVCRNTITWLRNHTRLSVAVPFDDNINFHQIVAGGIIVGVTLHAGPHMACNFPRVIAATEDEYKAMRSYFGDEQPESYWWFVKGVEGVTGILMVVLMAVAFASPLTNLWIVRKKIKISHEPWKKITGFNTFWYTHHLFVAVYALFIVHGVYLYLIKEWYEKTTWMYVAVPMLIYGAERATRALRSRIKPVKVTKATPYPRSALVLHMTKPQGFEYKSGQYMFVKCLEVARFEWHPFSITSTPAEEHLSVHIRALGDWTKKINDVFSKCEQRRESYPKVMIDGPYGAPAQEYKDYEVVMLVGLGIGATPMISILKDIISNTKSGGGGDGRPRKAYFYWMTREEVSFEWFKSILSDVEEANKEGVIEIQIYCTGVFSEGDARSALISMIQSLDHEKRGIDVVAGTHTKSHFGRPKWHKVFKRVALRHPDSTVGVFYCGQIHPVKDLRKLSSHFSQNTSTKFEFHKENF